VPLAAWGWAFSAPNATCACPVPSQLRLIRVVPAKRKLPVRTAWCEASASGQSRARGRGTHLGRQRPSTSVIIGAIWDMATIKPTLERTVPLFKAFFCAPYVATAIVHFHHTKTPCPKLPPRLSAKATPACLCSVQNAVLPPCSSSFSSAAIFEPRTDCLSQRNPNRSPDWEPTAHY
jgi:hypothetical protein